MYWWLNLSSKLLNYSESHPLSEWQKTKHTSCISWPLLLLNILREESLYMELIFICTSENKRNQWKFLKHLHNTEQWLQRYNCCTIFWYLGSQQPCDWATWTMLPCSSLVLWRLLSQDILNGWILEQPLQHSTGASMLKTFVRGQTILGPIAATAELTHIQCVRAFMFILEVTFQGVITWEGAATVWTFLRFIYTTTGRRGDSVMHASTCK